MLLTTRTKIDIYQFSTACSSDGFVYACKAAPELMDGAVLDFDMSHTPNTERGINDEDFPYSLTNEDK